MFKYFSLLGSLQKGKEVCREVKKPKQKTTKTKISDTTDLDDRELTCTVLYLKTSNIMNRLVIV